MKVFFAALALIVSSQSHAATTPEFDKVSAIAQKLDWRGYDVLACYSKGSQPRLVVGGVSFWNAPLRIFLAKPDGQIVPTEPVVEALMGETNKFKLNGQPVILNLGLKQMNQGTIPATLTVGPSETAQLLTCYFRNSGLE